jgi:ABC-type Mn2+/Zn2+ transport system permease subunit
MNGPFPTNPLLAAVPLSIACAVLSIFVVSRRWAFIGEGISHSGFGGAGMVWLLSLVFPVFNEPWVLMPAVTLFCLTTAIAIALLTHRGRTDGDTAIGVFMVASLALGFLAREIYRSHTGHDPVGFDDLLFGQVGALSRTYAVSTAMLSAAVILGVVTFGKELVFYTVDPDTARAAGVRTGLIHYLLLLTVTLTIVLGIRIAGSVLMTALLVLPGATGLAATKSLRAAFAVSIAVAVIAAMAGVAAHARWGFVPVGPTVVLVLFAMFLASLAVQLVPGFPRSPGRLIAKA